MTNFEYFLFALKFVAALGCGLVAGVFFAFSTFVMSGLGRLGPPQGIAAMQSINITAVTPMFMTALFGTGFCCLVLAVFSLVRWDQPGSGFLLAGSLIYITGTVLVTIFFNVPLNNALAAVDPASAEGADLWARYLVNWGVWNHVRTITSLLAAGLFTWSLV